MAVDRVRLDDAVRKTILDWVRIYGRAGLGLFLAPYGAGLPPSFVGTVRTRYRRGL